MSLVVKVSVRSRVLFPGDDLECTISLSPQHSPTQLTSQPAATTTRGKPESSTDDDASVSATDSDSLAVVHSANTNSSTNDVASASTSTNNNAASSSWSWWSSWFGSSSQVNNNNDDDDDDGDMNNGDDMGSRRRRPPPLVDYVTVQVLGKYVADSSWIRLSAPYLQQQTAADSSRLLFESAPCVVADGVDSCLVRYTFPLPRKIPPSFKGVAIKYFYCLRVAAKLRSANAVERVVTIPLRVINPLGNIAVIQVSPKPVLGVEAKLHDLQPLEADNRQAVQLTDTIAHAASAIELLGSPLVRARQRVTAVPSTTVADSLTSPQLRVASLSSYYRRLQREQQSQNVQNNVKSLFVKLSRPLSIEISRARRHVAQFTINRTAFQLGDVIVGQFDFSRATTSCYQVSCSLDYDEAVAVEMQPSASAAAAAAAVAAAPLTDSSGLSGAVIPSAELMPRASIDPVAVPARYAGSTTLRKTVAEAHSITVHTLRTGISLAIPSHAPYSFATSHVRVSWTLRFEFAIAARSRADNDDDDGVYGDALSQPAVDCLHWELPIQVLVPEKPDEFLFERDSERMVV